MFYHYAGNNPVKYTDPDGRIEISSSGGYIFFQESDEHENPIIKTMVGNSGNEIQVIQGYLLANDGKTKIYAYYKLERNYSSEDNFDCHGLTFTNGTFWIDDPEVEKILQADGYQQTNSPKKGDIFIQRDSDGTIFHSATVECYDESKNKVLVHEAMGSYLYEDENHVKHKTWSKWYTIVPSRDTFYSKVDNEIMGEN